MNMKRTHGQKGQIMIVSVLMISGTVLSATVLAGYLTLYHLRQAVDIENSAKSIFAADAGVEWQLYKDLKDNTYPQPTFTNGVTVSVTQLEPNVYRSVGQSGRSARAFEVDISSFAP